ncbi:hypothetical protein BJ165DRAFT_1527800 [Panaeolus papilionaceus]|nr:hypothetical protein BJ165DRAFT_1527800 [Panaeolus papilionaceus]
MAPTERRSTRSITRKNAAVAPSIDESVEDMDQQPIVEDEETQGMKRKRRADSEKRVVATKKQKKRQKVQKGVVGMLLEMPYEMRVEIFGYLDPLDLLNVGRTCQDLHDLVGSKSFAPIWQSSIRLTWPTMPGCPDGMAQPAFVELFFGKNCLVRRLLQLQSFRTDVGTDVDVEVFQGCGRKPTPSAPLEIYHLWDARTRLCGKCVRAQWSPSDMMLPRFVKPKHRAICALQGLAPKCYVRSRCGDRDLFFSLKHMEEWKAAFYAQKDDRRKREWVSETKTQWTNIKTHVSHCENWFRGVVRAIFAEQERELIRKRKEKVTDFLVSIGWGDELEEMTDNHPRNLEVVAGMCEKNITKKVLMEKKELLEDYMNIQRAKRLEKERIKCIHERLRQLGGLYLAVIDRERALGRGRIFEQKYPRTGDIFAIPRFMDKIMDTPVDVRVDSRDFREIEDDLQGVMEEARTIVRDKMLVLVREGLADKVYDPNTVIDLATMAFCETWRSNSRNDFLTVPQAMHAYMPYYAGDLASRCARSRLQSVPWNSGNRNLRFDRESYDALCSVMIFLGLDPDTATLKEVQNLDPMIECVKCNDLGQGRLIMNWTQAATHLQGCTSRNLAGFELLQGEDALKARASLRELTRKQLYRREPKPLTMCIHCLPESYIDLPLDQMLWHLDKSHGIRCANDEDFKIAHENEMKVEDYPTMECRIWPPRAPTTVEFQHS